MRGSLWWWACKDAGAEQHSHVGRSLAGRVVTRATTSGNHLRKLRALILAPAANLASAALSEPQVSQKGTSRISASPPSISPTSTSSNGAGLQQPNRGPTQVRGVYCLHAGGDTTQPAPGRRPPEPDGLQVRAGGPEARAPHQQVQQVSGQNIPCGQQLLLIIQGMHKEVLYTRSAA